MKKININKTLVILALIYVLIFTHTYLSMNEYSNSISSTCLECSYFIEIARYSLISLFILPIIFFANILKLSNRVTLFLLFFFFILFLFLVNSNLFEARVSSWSTYSENELYIVVLKKMRFTLPIFGFLFYLYLKFFYFQDKNSLSNQL